MVCMIDSVTANQEENNESIVAEPDDKDAAENDATDAEDIDVIAKSVENDSQQKVIIVVLAISSVLSVIGGFVISRLRKNRKK